MPTMQCKFFAGIAALTAVTSSWQKFQAKVVATIAVYTSYVYPDSGSSFIQSLCYYAYWADWQRGTRIREASFQSTVFSFYFTVQQRFVLAVRL